jgi:hypothetical protein
VVEGALEERWRGFALVGAFADLARGCIASVSMTNVLSEEKKQQVIALGKLGWSLRRVEEATGVRRETAGAYLKAAGIAVRPPGAWGRRAPAKPAISNNAGSVKYYVDCF